MIALQRRMRYGGLPRARGAAPPISFPAPPPYPPYDISGVAASSFGRILAQAARTLRTTPAYLREHVRPVVGRLGPQSLRLARLLALGALRSIPTSHGDTSCITEPLAHGTPTHTSPKPSTLHRALSVLAAGRCSLSRSPSPIPPSAGGGKDKGKSAAVPDTLLRAQDLFAVALAHYFPDAVEADDSYVRERIKSESAPPLVMVRPQTSPRSSCSLRASAPGTPTLVRTRAWLLPTFVDRSAAVGALENRANTLVRVLWLMGSVCHPRLKDSVGEVLHAVCDRDAGMMSTLVGYENVAGFLFNKGIMSAPPQPAAPDAPTVVADGSEGIGAAGTSAAAAAALPSNINPLTGTAQEVRSPEPEMTPEEKEHEMEKLFVLFDRLERTGALPPSQNPMRRPIEKAHSCQAGNTF
ncbi:guanine nucleotide exchange factor synembryn-domain-containing protein [Mycena galericulata]|nr:guanine nucleotide exchange factor synembryn-domain-containing protein [Mycena galericulata]